MALTCPCDWVGPGGSHRAGAGSGEAGGGKETSKSESMVGVTVGALSLTSEEVACSFLISHFSSGCLSFPLVQEREEALRRQLAEVGSTSEEEEDEEEEDEGGYPGVVRPGPAV